MQLDFALLPETVQELIRQAVSQHQEITITHTGSGGRRNLAVVTPWPMRNRAAVSGHGGTGSQWTRHYESSGDPAAALDEP